MSIRSAGCLSGVAASIFPQNLMVEWRVYTLTFADSSEMSGRVARDTGSTVQGVAAWLKVITPGFLGWFAVKICYEQPSTA
jgi:hypothetical protein